MLPTGCCWEWAADDERVDDVDENAEMVWDKRRVAAAKAASGDGNVNGWLGAHAGSGRDRPLLPGLHGVE